MNILLMGARGCGKTTIGRVLADRLDRPFVDLDDAALGRLGSASVRDVWATLGEPAWRAAESDALAELLQGDDHIVALGGGTPIIPAARTAMEEHRRLGRARIVYLRCPAEMLAERLNHEGAGGGVGGGVGADRPSLTGRPPADEIADVLAEREPVYTAMADFVVDVAHRTPEQAAATIAEALKRG